MKSVVRNTLLLTASEDRFISENGIVGALGDEDQLMNSDLRMIVRLSRMRRAFPVGIASR